MYIAMEERKPIKVQNSKLSTTNHIIELLVNLDQNPNTKSKNYCGHICVCGDLYTYRDESNSVFGCSDNGSSFDLTIYWGSKVQNRKEIISGNSRRNLLFPLILFEDKRIVYFL